MYVCISVYMCLNVNVIVCPCISVYCMTVLKAVRVLFHTILF